MTGSNAASVALHDCHPRQDSLRDTLLAGLRARQKILPPIWFYDERGSRLFDRITELPEYYLTRTEIAITSLARFSDSFWGFQPLVTGSIVSVTLP